MSGIYFMSGVMPTFVPQPSSLPVGAFYYVGMTKRDLVERLEEHLYKLDQGSHSNQIIQEHYEKFGRGNLITGAIIDCSEYYLNTLEKVYIDRSNSFTGDNPFGWNKSKGGEGAKNYPLPFAFQYEETKHWGSELRVFMTGHPDLDPSGIMSLHEGKIDEFEGWTKT